MLTNDREKRICEKYRARDANGYVYCNECPLVRGYLICKAIAHYDRRTRTWEQDKEIDDAVD